MPPSTTPPDRTASLIERVVSGDPTVTADAASAASTSRDPVVLVVAALTSARQEHLVRARDRARTSRDRQLVVLADAYLRGDADLFDVLVREHLAAYPDQLLASWLAAKTTA